MFVRCLRVGEFSWTPSINEEEHSSSSKYLIDFWVFLMISPYANLHSYIHSCHTPLAPIIKQSEFTKISIWKKTKLKLNSYYA